MQLLIGNKNYSSWSLRPWLLLKHLAVKFEEKSLSFNDPSFHAKVKSLSGVTKVPVLLDGDVVVWDSLAICEYLAEKFPETHVWPQHRTARSNARSFCAEMHSGFTALRSAMPMNIEARLPGKGWNLAVQKDIDRISHIWHTCLEQHGGPFLFGPFSAVDAYFAPVCMRFITYQVALEPPLQAYLERVRQLGAMQEWITAAQSEHDFVADDEPYRLPPA